MCHGQSSSCSKKKKKETAKVVFSVKKETHRLREPARLHGFDLVFVVYLYS